MNTQTADEVIRLGGEAEYILSSDAYARVMLELEKQLIDAWAAGTFKTPEEREDAFNRVRGARMFRDRCNALIENMKLQKARFERNEKAAKANRND